MIAFKRYEKGDDLRFWRKEMVVGGDQWWVQKNFLGGDKLNITKFLSKKKKKKNP